MYDMPPGGDGGGTDPGRLLPGDGGRPAAATPGRPDLGAARRRDRRRPAHRRGDRRPSSSSWWWPATRRPPSCWATPGTGAGATPTQRAKPFADPRRVPDWVEETLRYRHLQPDAAAGDRASRCELHGTTIAEGERVLLLVGSANRDELGLRRPRAATTSTADTPGPGQLRQRAPLLHGGAPGPARGPHRAGRAGVAGGRLRRRPGRRSSASTPSTCGARRPADDGDAALMPRFDPQPDRRPSGGDRRLVGHRPGHGRRDWPRAGHPVVLGARRVAKCEDGGGRASGGRRARPSPSASTWPTPARSSGSRRAAEDTFGPVEIVVSNAGAGHGRARSSRPRPRTSRRRAGRQRRRRPPPGAGLLPGMVARRRGDLVFVTSDVAERPRPAMAAYVDLEVGPRGVRPLAPDGARGDRRPGHDPAARPDA